MVSQDSLLVTLVQLVDRLPMPSAPQKRGRGHPHVYSDRLFLKALVIMMVRHVHNVHELLSVLAQPTAEMQRLHTLLCEQGRFPTRRTWERRFKAIPGTLPAQIGCLGRHLLDLIQPWLTSGRAVAMDSTILRARGGVWHQKHREQGEIPHTSIDTQALWWLLAISIRQMSYLRTPSHVSRALRMRQWESRMSMHSPAHLHKGD
jgi:hypothetical protein